MYSFNLKSFFVGIPLSMKSSTPPPPMRLPRGGSVTKSPCPALPRGDPEADDPCNVYDFQGKPIVIFSLRILVDVISAGKYITDRELPDMVYAEGSDTWVQRR